MRMYGDYIARMTDTSFGSLLKRKDYTMTDKEMQIETALEILGLFNRSTYSVAELKAITDTANNGTDTKVTQFEVMQYLRFGYLF